MSIIKKGHLELQKKKPIEKILERALTDLNCEVGASYVFIGRLRHQSKTLSNERKHNLLVFAHTPPHYEVPFCVPLSSSLLIDPVSTNEYTMSNDESSISLCFKNFPFQFSSYRDYFGLPLIVGDKCVGLLGFVNARCGVVSLHQMDLLMPVVSLLGGLTLLAESINPLLSESDGKDGDHELAFKREKSLKTSGRKYRTCQSARQSGMIHRRSLSWDSSGSQHHLGKEEALRHFLGTMREGLMVFFEDTLISSNEAAASLLGFTQQGDILDEFPHLDNLIHSIDFSFPSSGVEQGPNFLENCKEKVENGICLRFHALLNLNPQLKIAEKTKLFRFVFSSVKKNSDWYYVASFSDAEKDEVVRSRLSLLSYLSQEMEEPLEIISSELKNGLDQNEKFMSSTERLNSLLQDTFVLEDIVVGTFAPKHEVWNVDY